MANILINGDGTYSCYPPTYGMYGEQLSWGSYQEAKYRCRGNEMTTPGGNAMPIRAEKQKTGIKKRNVANRVKKRTQGFAGDWFNRY